jgi:hypothetical protein
VVGWLDGSLGDGWMGAVGWIRIHARGRGHGENNASQRAWMELLQRDGGHRLGRWHNLDQCMWTLLSEDSLGAALALVSFYIRYPKINPDSHSNLPGPVLVSSALKQTTPITRFKLPAHPSGGLSVYVPPSCPCKTLAVSGGHFAAASPPI